MHWRMVVIGLHPYTVFAKITKSFGNVHKKRNLSGIKTLLRVSTVFGLFHAECKKKLILFALSMYKAII